jgi:hypothetical protein
MNSLQRPKCLWKLTIDPRGKDDPEKLSFKFCREEKIVGVGWRLDRRPADKAEADRLFAERHRKTRRPGWDAMVHRISEGDHVWVYGDRRYYVCRVCSDWRYEDGDPWDTSRIRRSHTRPNGTNHGHRGRSTLRRTSAFGSLRGVETGAASATSPRTDRHRAASHTTLLSSVILKNTWGQVLRSELRPMSGPYPQLQKGAYPWRAFSGEAEQDLGEAACCSVASVSQSLHARQLRSAESRSALGIR